MSDYSRSHVRHLQCLLCSDMDDYAPPPRIAVAPRAGRAAAAKKPAAYVDLSEDEEDD